MEAVKALVTDVERVLPFGASGWTRDATLATLEVLLERLVGLALGVDDPRTRRRWLVAKLESRLGDLPRRFPKLISSAQGTVATFCDASNRDRRRRAALATWDEGAVAGRLQVAAATLRALDDGHVLELELGNLVEAAAFKALGTTRTAVAFLLSCFRDGAAVASSQKSDSESTRALALAVDVEGPS